MAEYSMNAPLRFKEKLYNTVHTGKTLAFQKGHCLLSEGCSSHNGPSRGNVSIKVVNPPKEQMHNRESMN